MSNCLNCLCNIRYTVCKNQISYILSLLWFSLSSPKDGYGYVCYLGNSKWMFVNPHFSFHYSYIYFLICWRVLLNKRFCIFHRLAKVQASRNSYERTLFMLTCILFFLNVQFLMALCDLLLKKWVLQWNKLY